MTQYLDPALWGGRLRERRRTGNALVTRILVAYAAGLGCALALAWATGVLP